MDAGASAGGRVGASLQDVGERKPNPPLSEFYPEKGDLSRKTHQTL